MPPVKEDMVLRQFNLRKGIEIRQFLSTIGYNLPETWPVYNLFSLEWGSFSEVLQYNLNWFSEETFFSLCWTR